MNRKIDAFDYSAHFTKNVMKGFLLTTAADDRVNTMVIGWGTIGIQWGREICIVYVRTSRYTHEMLDRNPEFTVNIPLEKLDPEVIRICGRKSGRDTDKIREAGLTLTEPECISVPGIREAPVTLECRVIYRQTQDTDAYAPDISAKFYPADDPVNTVHTAFYGEIVNAYIAE